MRDGHLLMSAALELTELLPEAERPSGLPRWLTMKQIPRADRPGDAVHQLVQTGPERLEWGPIWRAHGELHFPAAQIDELGSLAPREIVAAQYWSAVDLSVGYGRVLMDLGASP